jgi:hypothetical protein
MELKNLQECGKGNKANKATAAWSQPLLCKVYNFTAGGGGLG